MVKSIRSVGDFAAGGGVNFSTLVYLLGYDLYARPVTFYPIISQPTVASYLARGIYNTRLVQVAMLDGSFLVDQQTILDIREVEFAIMPQQQDRLAIPMANAGPDLGEFEVVSSSSNGGGETTLVIRKWVPALP
ncbi:MAG TPA: hypothetical protein VGI65_16845 [Steroidobacteraceae bacterium]|jgi:hypothetical protein